ncbi:MAG: trimethylamine methyltransferase family protein, partial [Anaerolineae bacterium]
MPRTFGGRQAFGRYSRMGPRTCEQIHMASLEILERVGVEVHDQKTRAILGDHGADVDGKIVRIPAHMVVQALNVTPS